MDLPLGTLSFPFQLSSGAPAPAARHPLAADIADPGCIIPSWHLFIIKFRVYHRGQQGEPDSAGLNFYLIPVREDDSG